MEGFSNWDREEPFEPFTVMLFKGLQIVAFMFFLAYLAINTAHRVRERVMNGVNAYRIEGRRVVTDDGAALPSGRVTEYIRNLVVKAEKQGRQRRLDQTLLLRGLADKLRSPMQFGAFAGDALLKLGLLGTIVGFILMLFPTPRWTISTRPR